MRGLVRGLVVAGTLGLAGPAHGAPEFPEGHDEWAYFAAGARPPRVTGAELGSDREEGGTSFAVDRLVDTGRGYFSYALDYEIHDRYVYASFRREARIRTVETYPHLRRKYLSLFARGTAGTYLEITAWEGRDRASRWRLRLPAEAGPETWTNLRLPVADLGPAAGREAAREMDALVIAVVRRDADPLPIRGRLELALLSFTDDPAPLPTLPALPPGSLPRLRDYHGLTGPAGLSPVPAAEAPPTSPARYETGEPSRLALWLTDEASDWLGLAHGLKALGVPFLIVRSGAAATRHRAVLAYPSLRTVPLADRAALSAHVSGGGTLIALLDGERDAALEAVLGTRAKGPPADHDALVLTRRASGRARAEGPEDRAARAIPLFDKVRGKALAKGCALVEGPGLQVVARYDDGQAAATRRIDAASGGRAYAWGVDFGRLLLTAQNDGATGAAARFVNHYRPANDLFLLFLAEAWRAASPRTAVRVRTAPLGRKVPVLLTHDVDESSAVRRALVFAESETRQGVPATYFLFPKYSLPEFEDDDYIFHTIGGRPAAEWWRDLDRRGHELASHSASHASDFDEPGPWPMGTGAEAFETYDPRFVCDGPHPEEACARVPRVRRCRTEAFACGLWRTVGGSLLGDLRVSRFLVEHVSTPPVRGFRSGFLSWPPHLNEALAAAGYAYTSIGTCNTHLTHLPYQLNHGKGRAELDVFEFCIGSEDQDQPLSAADRRGGRLRQAVDLVHRLAGYGGVFVQLIHPADTWSGWRDNLRFQEALVARLRAVPGLAHFATLSGFGDFWRARDAVEVDVVPGPSSRVHRLRISAPRPVEGLSFDVPATWRAVRNSNRPVRVELSAARRLLVIRDGWSGLLEIDVSE